MPGLDEVIKARAEEGEGAIGEAKSYVEKLRERLGAISAAVFGNYARRDFNLWSDIDVIVAPQKFKDVFIRKCLALLDAPPKIEAICWTPEEAAKALKKPSWIEALKNCITPTDNYGIFTMCQTWNNYAAGKSPMATFAQTAAT